MEMAVTMLGSSSVELYNIWSLTLFYYFILTLDTPVHVYLLGNKMKVSAAFDLIKYSVERTLIFYRGHIDNNRNVLALSIITILRMHWI